MKPLDLGEIKRREKTVLRWISGLLLVAAYVVAAIAVGR